nr:hypothetical protein [Tanacetum cinerariifolium]
MEDLKQQYLDELKRLSNLEYHHEIKIAKLKENFNGMSIEIRKKEKLLQQEQWTYLSTHPSKRLTSFCYDDDDDDDEDYTSVLFDAEYKSDSSDDQSCSDEDVLEKIEFAVELTLLKSIPLGIDEADFDCEEDIRLIKKLLYDNSSLRPPEEFVSVNSNAKIKSFSPSPILVKDSDSLMKEINLFCTPDYPMLSGIMDEDYDSERDILIHKDLPRNNTLSFAKKVIPF